MPIKYEQADKCFEQSSEQFLDRKIRSSTCGQTLALHAFLRRTAELEPGKLDASKLRITLTTTPCEVPGRNSADVWSMNNCTDHMVTARWTVDRGWEAPEIRPVEPLPILPTASCLHYATQCFEGLKVYRGVDKKLRLFRPDCNCERLIMSSKRISLPQPDAAAVEKLILELIKVDGKRWLPADEPGKSLYIRPAVIGTGAQLGGQMPTEALLFILVVEWPDIATQSPPGAMKKEALKLMTSENGTTRAWPGGFGSAKIGANYGPSYRTNLVAQRRGFDQVLWLFGEEGEVTEAGTSNFFVVWQNKETGRKELVTAPVTHDIILNGVTRRSVLELARERLTGSYKDGGLEYGGLDVVERKFTGHEIERKWKEGCLYDAFVTGTTYFVMPVSSINFQGSDINLPSRNGTSALYTPLFRKWLSDIMYGETKHDWAVVVDNIEE